MELKLEIRRRVNEDLIKQLANLPIPFTRQSSCLLRTGFYYHLQFLKINTPFESRSPYFTKATQSTQQ